MKLKRSEKSAVSRRMRKRLSGKARLALATIAGLAILIMLFDLRPDIARNGIAKIEKRWGGALFSLDRPLAEKVSIVLGSYLREASEELPTVPEIVIDVPFKGMQKIYKKREDALENWVLVQAEDDFVKADIRTNGETVPIKMRLKGDWFDHLEGRKWSFRIHVRGGAQLFGMRRFSIQNPATRGFQSELIFFEALKFFNVMSPRYSFVDVTLNGDPMGLMAVEEFFC